LLETGEGSFKFITLKLYICNHKYTTMAKILIIGACGQIGTELTKKLRSIYGRDNVIASDVRKGDPEFVASGPFEVANALDFNQIQSLIEKYQVEDVYLMAALLSATAEKNPAFAWDLNMNSLFHVLNLAKDGKFKKLYWPSSIAVFGPTTPKQNTPQYTVMETFNCVRYIQTGGRKMVRVLQ
jgi:nucleoside-diphosphate-sugar epimerase